MPPNPQKSQGAARALVKVEQLTQMAFALPAAALVGWLLGAVVDRMLHTHWVYILGLVLGVIAGFILLFRLIASPATLAGTAYDPQAARGPGFDDRKDEKR